MSSGDFTEYAREILTMYDERPEADRSLVFDAVSHAMPGRVLDVGCGPGQELLPFLEKSDAECVAVDIAEAFARVAGGFFRDRGFSERVRLVRAAGEALPFADDSFDVVLCRTSLPYMDNEAALGEMARVLDKDGILLLKTHAPAFYFAMLYDGLKGAAFKEAYYSIICLAAGSWHLLTGKRPAGGMWQGKEVFQTNRTLSRNFASSGMHIAGELLDSNPRTPSYIVKRNTVN